MDSTFTLIISLLGALGIGTFLGSTITSGVEVWKQKQVRLLEKERWLRDKRFEAFSKTVKMIENFMVEQVWDDILYHSRECADSILFIDDEDLLSQLRQYIKEMGRILIITKSNTEIVDQLIETGMHRPDEYEETIKNAHPEMYELFISTNELGPIIQRELRKILLE